MTPAGFEPTIPAKQNHALDRAASGIGMNDVSSQLHRATNSNKMHINDDGNQ